MEPLKQTAFYYPGVIWRDPGWVKSLTLFFDEVALLVPDYIRDRPLRLDPAIAEPLKDAGLLRILSPESLVGKDVAEKLAAALTDIISTGALDHLPPDSQFETLSWSRMGGWGDQELAEMIFDELVVRGLARPSEDGASIPMHRTVHSLYLVLLAQLLRGAGPRLGLDLMPATDRPQIQKSLVELLKLPSPKSGVGSVVSLDLEIVAPNLEAVALDEVLDFRASHGAQYQAYARQLRAVVRDLSTSPLDEHGQILCDRRDEIREAAEDLRRGPLQLLGSAAGIGLGVAGGVTSLITGDAVMGAVAIAQAAAGAISLPRKQTTAYSYLFEMKRQFV